MGREKKQEYALFTAWGAFFYCDTRKSILFRNHEIWTLCPLLVSTYFHVSIRFMARYRCSKKRLSHCKLFFTNRKYWCLYFFISLCNSKSRSIFGCRGSLRPRTMYGRIHKLVRLCDNPVFSTYRLYYNRCL